MPKSLFGYTNILLRNSDLDISARSLSISGSVLKINFRTKCKLLSWPFTSVAGPQPRWHSRCISVGAGSSSAALAQSSQIRNLDQCGAEDAELKQVEFSFDHTGPLQVACQ